MGTVCETPSPESSTMPVVRPEAYSESTAWIATYMAGTLNISSMIWVIFSRLAFGLSGASVGLRGARGVEGEKGGECAEEASARTDP